MINTDNGGGGGGGGGKKLEEWMGQTVSNYRARIKQRDCEKQQTCMHVIKTSRQTETKRNNEMKRRHRDRK